MEPYDCGKQPFPPAGTMYVFEGDNLVWTVRKEAGVCPTHLLQRSRLGEGRYTVVCISDTSDGGRPGSVFKRDYVCEFVNPPLNVRPVFS